MSFRDEDDLLSFVETEQPSSTKKRSKASTLNLLDGIQKQRSQAGCDSCRSVLPVIPASEQR